MERARLQTLPSIRSSFYFIIYHDECLVVLVGTGTRTPQTWSIVSFLISHSGIISYHDECFLVIVLVGTGRTPALFIFFVSHLDFLFTKHTSLCRRT